MKTPSPFQSLISELILLQWYYMKVAASDYKAQSLTNLYPPSQTEWNSFNNRDKFFIVIVREGIFFEDNITWYNRYSKCWHSFPILYFRSDLLVGYLVNELTSYLILDSWNKWQISNTMITTHYLIFQNVFPLLSFLFTDFA